MVVIGMWVHAQADDKPRGDALVPWSRQIGFMTKALPAGVKLDAITLQQESTTVFSMTLRGQAFGESPQETINQINVALRNMRTAPRLSRGELTVESIEKLPADSNRHERIEFTISCRFEFSL